MEKDGKEGGEKKDKEKILGRGIMEEWRRIWKREERMKILGGIAGGGMLGEWGGCSPGYRYSVLMI